MGTFLVFRLVDNSIVNVVPYGLSACEMEFEDWESRLTTLNLPVCDHKPEDSAETTNPQFCVTLKEYHRYRLTLYKEFATETGLAYKKVVVLEDPQGRYWHVALRCQRGCFPLKMTIDWSELHEANGLAFGDTCSFQFIPSKNVIRLEYV
ncbi:unnamed protein product [Fraxinus pennsylvanica]|uniref:TF-B3 domain-containing protein n=1 Tax=Fraxinus pennsylvanica TaxID=56036 RepID=A0AAD2DZS8_9LAMI|nr:unnamed protein product [Fraxinus pennsylvanica]